MNTRTLFMVLGAGALYYWWQSQQTTVGTTATTSPGLPGGTTSTGTGQTVTTTPPVTVPPAQTGTPTPGTSAGSTGSPSSSPANSQLDAWYKAMLTAASSSGDPTISGMTGDRLTASGNSPWSVWNYYLGQVSGVQNLPDYQDVTGAVDPNTPLTIGTYWGLIRPWLVANRGLSGLAFALPRFSTYYSRYYGGWSA